MTDEIWEYFNSRCAYCDQVLHRGYGQIDHLVPVAILRQALRGYFVLACPPCNGNEKREMDWESFLREKCGCDEVAFASRRAKIAGWIKAVRGADAEVAPELAQAIDDALREITLTIDHHISLLLALKKRV